MKILNFLKVHQNVLVLSLGYLAVGALAFGIGRMTASTGLGPEITVEQAFAPLNNTAKASDNQSGASGGTPGAVNGHTNGTIGQTAGSGTGQTSGTSECPGLIKGNINSKNDKVYHLPGGSSYNRTDPEQCFATEEEAKAAGFRKAGG